jgi:broad specificity phosphatase PhoE
VSRFLFVRHAAIDGLGTTIAGRKAGVVLNAAGREQVKRLARRLAGESIDAIYASPQSRATETAQAVANLLGLELQIAADLDEIDFGDWTGKTYQELASVPEWRAFNALRSARRIPNGELLLEAQTRIINLMTRLEQRHTNQTIALVSHGDIIRGAFAHFLGMPLDFLLRFEISPGSVSAIELSADAPRILWINRTE